MKLSLFLDSYIGMYIAQAVCHSLIAALVVDRAVQIWRITNPLIRQRFSFVVIVFPVLSFPLFQMLNPDRGSLSFRMEALLDINRWLSLELLGTIPLTYLFVGLLGLTSLVFLFQELVPVLKHTLESKQIHTAGEHRYGPVIREIIDSLTKETFRTSIIEDDDLVLFSSTRSKPTVFVSSGLIEALDREQITAAVAHEIAHLERNKRPLLIVMFILRMLMFFNPVVLVEFRRVVHEEEKICDDAAVSMTRNPQALSETLGRFNHGRESFSLEQVKDISALGTSLQEYGHSVHIETRIARLKEEIPSRSGGEWFHFALTIGAITVINYFVV